MIFSYFGIPTSEALISKTLDEYKKHISIKCVREVGASIFEGKASVTDACCHDLASVGKNCHDLFFNFALAPKPNVGESRALAKSEQVWSPCVAITVSPTSSITIPTSEVLNLKILYECIKHISIQCAGEVGASIFEGGASVTNACCHDLVYVGKTCHDRFFNYVLASKPNVAKFSALVKSAQVWSRCVATCNYSFP
ncbi:hypothetical protein PRUPE_2G101000 [Prunus persica]|uniref:Prolamin-like domain-containing protein n=1 Tax=Prunus persica TaxID=3760 RepID=A0A251QDW0_PRUPE|nr:hypothetical protein PRUPE_2G101000 [Prunus persica]